MIGRLNHVAIAVPSLEEGARVYGQSLGAKLSVSEALPEHGVTVLFIELPNTKIELLEPLGDNSPIAAFLQRNPAGGIHHICYETPDIMVAKAQLERQGMRVLGEPKIGAHGKRVLFLHPKDALGTLTELEEV